jgi:hypothetical protein
MMKELLRSVPEESILPYILREVDCKPGNYIKTDRETHRKVLDGLQRGLTHIKGQFFPQSYNSQPSDLMDVCFFIKAFADNHMFGSAHRPGAPPFSVSKWYADKGKTRILELLRK